MSVHIDSKVQLQFYLNILLSNVPKVTLEQAMKAQKWNRCIARFLL